MATRFVRDKQNKDIGVSVERARDAGYLSRSRTRTTINGDALTSRTIDMSRDPNGDVIRTRTRTTVDGTDVTSRTMTITRDPGQKPTRIVTKSNSTLTPPPQQ